MMGLFNRFASLQKVFPFTSLISILFISASSVAYTPLSKLPPHAGYHGTGAIDTTKPFFEGWYLRVTTKQQGSIALIFHVFDPHINNEKSSTRARARATRTTTTTSSRQGVGMQVICPLGTLAIESNDMSTFRANSHNLEIRNLFPSSSSSNNDIQNDFFRLTENRASGRGSTSSTATTTTTTTNTRSGTGRTTISLVEFDFDIIPEIGWGGSGTDRQYSTAGWLAAFPVFEPHYQVLISKGRAKGSMTVYDTQQNENEPQSTTYDLTDATVYLEKNWGGSFPSKWWWIQANTFASGLCVTSTGARRRIPVLMQEEEVALVGLHWNGKFLPFPNVQWKVTWGQWKIKGIYEQYSVELEGTCTGTGVPVRCPTDAGMEEIALETYSGMLHVKLYENGQLILDESTSEACLEVGGLPWTSREWVGESAMKEPLKSLVMNVGFERRASDLLQIASSFVDIPGL